MPITAGIIGAAAIGSIGSTLAAAKQSKAQARARNIAKQSKIEALDFKDQVEKQRQVLTDINAQALRTLSDRAQTPIRELADVQFKRQIGLATRELAKTGNLRSGVAQDLFLQQAQLATERSSDRQLAELTNIAKLSGNLNTSLLGSAIDLFGISADQGKRQGQIIIDRGATQASNITTQADLFGTAFSSGIGGVGEGKGQGGLFGGGPNGKGIFG